MIVIQLKVHRLSFSNETFRLKSTNVEKDAILDIKANAFYRIGQTAFLMIEWFAVLQNF